eukprot:TRINITY_DN93374_c0_g1_i1.p1 TRINITY_DN93374_c0_g1~~TRINITY_DN93374_c0_g1_i1.p1  ORF type:complete len:303 (+),score=27.72 TRINITY_DN93374_c0_g1_i1:56-964(+)
MFSVFSSACPRRNALAANVPWGVAGLPSDALVGFCNSADELCPPNDKGYKVLWFIRHGESTGNVARHAAEARDEAAGGGDRFKEEYRKNPANLDACLTEKGLEQAASCQASVASWKLKPTLIVSSPLTRAIQTAATVFDAELESGHAQLVIRPELREYFASLQEDKGRPLAELRSCPTLQSLKRWQQVERALSDEATADWRQDWDAGWAQSEGIWETHCEDGERMEALRAWLQRQPHKAIATVSHWGTINNFMNRQPWADKAERTPVTGKWPVDAWPPGGMAHRFHMPNCGWIACLFTPTSD